MSETDRPVKCKHLNAVVHDSNLVGWASCPDCESAVTLPEVFNNLLDAMREKLE